MSFPSKTHRNTSLWKNRNCPLPYLIVVVQSTRKQAKSILKHIEIYYYTSDFCCTKASSFLPPPRTCPTNSAMPSCAVKLLLGNPIVQHYLPACLAPVCVSVNVLSHSTADASVWTDQKRHLSSQHSFFKMSCFNPITGKELRGNVKPKSSSSLHRRSAQPWERPEHTLWQRPGIHSCTSRMAQKQSQESGHLNQKTTFIKNLSKKKKAYYKGKAYKYRPFRTSLLVNHHYKI